MNVRTGEVRAFGKVVFATAVNPPAREMILLDWKDGSQDVLANLGEDGAFVDDGFADDHDLTVGSRSSDVPEREHTVVHDRRDLRPTHRGIALRAGHRLGAGVGRGG